MKSFGNFVEKRKTYLLWVVLPTLLVALYFVLLASDQYESEARFFIKSGSDSSRSQAMSGAGAALLSSAPSISEEVTLSVVDYLQSYDAIRHLREAVDLPKVYNRPTFDVVSRLGSNNTDERLRKYLFKNFGMVDAYVDINSGLGVLKVRAFSPADANAISKRMLDGADKLVQEFSQRAEQDALGLAEANVSKAEEALVEQKARMAQFRASRSILDPERTSNTMTDLLAGLEQQRAQAQVDLTSALRYLDKNSPRIVELQRQVASLQAQIDAQKQTLTRPQGSLANTLSSYEEMRVRTQFAEANLTSALTSLQQARDEAARHHLFLVAVVKPNLPQESEFPKRIVAILTVFAVMNAVFGIGWLILTGIREHVA
ncbi:hypothetical protein [Caballeronia cordobensis]|uniref:hypothetical protein n=1 Tax=Caballeronia cordobensis TaxID=1353886 RepID=UPI0006AD828C|nr:hypothetical protein [Caballeronia cordobensis]